MNDYFWLHKLILKICGVSLHERHSTSYQIYKVFILCLCISSILQEVYTIVSSFDDVDVLAGLVSVCGSQMTGIVRLFFVLKNRLLINETLDSLHRGLFRPDPGRGGRLEELLIKRCVSSTYRQVAFYYIAGIATALNGDVIALVSKFKTNDYKLWEAPWIRFGLFEVNTTTKYFLVYIYQSVSIFILGIITMTIDLLIVAIFTHLTTQLNILANFIKNEDYGGDSIDALQLRTRQVATYHQSIVAISEKIEENFNVLFLAILAGSTVILCFTMYLATLHPALHPRSFREFTYFITITVSSFLYCYYGDKITEASESITFACFDANFIGTDLSFQKDLIFITMRSQKPIRFTAGKFTTISLTTFTSVMRTAYSFFMVIRNVREEG